MRTIIVGGVAGGMSTATRLRRLDPTAEIIVVERSAHVSFANCGLPYHLGGVIDDREALLLQTPDSLHARFDLDVRTLTEVTAVDPAARLVTLRNVVTGEVVDERYDHLVLSPGAAPFVPPIPGVERAKTLRTMEDLDRLRAAVSADVRDVVVVGGGFIGLETAENLHDRGLDVTVVELADQVMAPLDAELATLVADELARHDVRVRLGVSVDSIAERTVELSDGTVLPADLVVLAIGVRPETTLAREAGLAIGPRGGIAVDDTQRTSDPHIFAVGDATEKLDAVDGSPVLVPLANLANRHGRRVADAIAGRETSSGASQGTAIVKVFDLTVAATGWNERRARAAGRDVEVIHTHPASHAGYYPGAETMTLKLVLDRADGSILGAQGVGRDGVDKRIDVLATAMHAGLPAPELADLELAYAPPFGSAKDPVNVLGYIAENRLSDTVSAIQWHELDDALGAGAELVDVRSAEEFARGHIPGARNIPVDTLRDEVSTLGAGPIVLYCAVGQRGHIAASYLSALGHSVTNLDGGIATWRHTPAGRASAGSTGSAGSG